jgi:hypothetical protein
VLHVLAMIRESSSVHAAADHEATKDAAGTCTMTIQHRDLRLASPRE